MKMFLPGSFAPSLSQSDLAKFAVAINKLPADLKGPLEQLHAIADHAVKANWPDRPGEQHLSKRGKNAMLTEAEMQPVRALLPTQGLAALGAQFDEITDKATRDMAFHLLWYATELSIGRIPITTDKI